MVGLTVEAAFFSNSTLRRSQCGCIVWHGYLIRYDENCRPKIFRFVLTLTSVADQRCLARVSEFFVLVHVLKSLLTRTTEVGKRMARVWRRLRLRNSAVIPRFWWPKDARSFCLGNWSLVFSVFIQFDTFQIDARFHHSASLFINRRFRVHFYGYGATKKTHETQFSRTSIETFYSLKDSLKQGKNWNAVIVRLAQPTIVRNTRLRRSTRVLGRIFH